MPKGAKKDTHAVLCTVDNESNIELPGMGHHRTSIEVMNLRHLDTEHGEKNTHCETLPKHDTHGKCVSTLNLCLFAELDIMKPKEQIAHSRAEDKGNHLHVQIYA